jgi:hypothetical protein
MATAEQRYFRVHMQQTTNTQAVKTVDVVDQHDVAVPEINPLSLNLCNMGRRVKIEAERDITKLTRRVEGTPTSSGRGRSRTAAQEPARLAPPDHEYFECVYPVVAIPRDPADECD